MEQEPEPLSADALELTTLPFTELDSRIERGHSDLLSLTSQLVAAEGEYALVAQPRSYRSPEAHAIALRDNLGDLETVEVHVQASAGTVREAARLMEDATSVDRQHNLSDTDMVRANAAREFVKENCDKLTLEELCGKVQQALQTNDTAQSWLYLRYGAQRLSESRAEDRQSLRDTEAFQAALKKAGDGMRDTSGRDTSARAKALRLAAAQLEGRAKARSAALQETDRRTELFSMF